MPYVVLGDAKLGPAGMRSKELRPLEIKLKL